MHQSKRYGNVSFEIVITYNLMSRDSRLSLYYLHMPQQSTLTPPKSPAPKPGSLQTPDGGRWPRQLSAANEAGILDAAFEVFKKHGFNGATTELIAKKAGISKPTLYRRYKNKLALFEQVVYQSLEAARGAFDDIQLDPSTPEASLREYALKIREINGNDRYVETNRMMIAQAARQPELVQLWRQSLLTEILDRLISYFKTLVKNGQMDHDYPELAARNFLVTFAGSFRPLYGIKESVEERDRVFESDLKTFIRGCRISPPEGRAS